MKIVKATKEELLKIYPSEKEESPFVDMVKFRMINANDFLLKERELIEKWTQEILDEE